MQTYPIKNLRRTWLLLAAVLVLTACGGGGSGITKTNIASQTTGPTNNASEEKETGTPNIPPPPPPPPAATGSFSLSWTAPTTRADGTPLSLADIDGYRVYYGTSRGSYPNQVNITNGAATGKTVNNLAPGKKYYLIMTTYDNAGRESAPSSEIAKTAI